MKSTPNFPRNVTVPAKTVAQNGSAPKTTSQHIPAQAFDEPKQVTPRKPTEPGAAVQAKVLKLLSTAARNGAFSRFGQLIDNAGLTDTLNGNGPFTLLAPTDKAFERLPAGKFEQLLDPANKDELVSLVNYHILSGRRSVSDIGKWPTARTMQGQAAPIRTDDGEVRIDGARVLYPDIESTNGLLHGIDTVNMPVATAKTVRSVDGTMI